MCNFFAQPDALAFGQWDVLCFTLVVTMVLGKTIAELEAENVSAQLCVHKEFSGNRPSLSLLFPRLSAHTLGQLLALYEHRVCVQGFVWGINSFDQWGVELGKVLALKLRTQIKEFRKNAEASNTSSEADPSQVFQGLNPSTNFLLRRYLSHNK
jgi:glucose-6-phosphate isomerase